MGSVVRGFNFLISRDEAVKLVKNTSKFAHVMVVSSIMAGLATRLGENVDKWWLAGLLHDLDFDETGADRSRHGVVAAERLSGLLPEDCLYAIKAHDYRTGFSPVSSLEVGLVAVDSLAVLIGDAGGSGSITEEALQSAMREALREKPWLKRNILQCENLGLGLAEFLKIGLESARVAFAT